LILADIRFCTRENLRQILEVDRTSPHPWPEGVISRDLVVGDTGLSYLGGFAPAAENKLVGYAVLGDEKGNGLLMNLVIVPKYRRCGFGAQLVVAAAECAAEMGFATLVLRVRLSNFAALALYRSLGFRTDATRESFYSDGDVAQYMSAKLPLVISED
jgi:ribosomal protein S18 acetylase RimI-like enzyme